MEDEPTTKKSLSSSSELTKDAKVNISCKTGITDDLPEVFACTLCRKSYPGKSYSASHMKLHLEYKMIECPDCDSRFTHRSNLLKHMRRHKEEVYCCGECGKTFKDGSSLSRHKLTHSGAKKCICDVCGWKFASISRLKPHSRIVHSYEQKCIACEMKFSSKEYPCFKCDEIFSTPVSSKEHVCINRFPCWRCKAVFTSRKELRNHSSTHWVEEKGIQCVCDNPSKVEMPLTIIEESKTPNGEKEVIHGRLICKPSSIGHSYCFKSQRLFPAKLFRGHKCLWYESLKEQRYEQHVNSVGRSGEVFHPKVPFTIKEEPGPTCIKPSEEQSGLD